jgi:hypothetical protein
MVFAVGMKRRAIIVSAERAPDEKKNARCRHRAFSAKGLPRMAIA